MKKKHSSLPWSYNRNKEFSGHMQINIYQSPESRQFLPSLAKLTNEYISIEEHIANAEFIIKAVNNHYALLEILDMGLDMLEEQATQDLLLENEDFKDWEKKARAIIKESGGACYDIK